MVKTLIEFPFGTFRLTHMYFQNSLEKVSLWLPCPDQRWHCLHRREPGATKPSWHARDRGDSTAPAPEPGAQT